MGGKVPARNEGIDDVCRQRHSRLGGVPPHRKTLVRRLSNWGPSKEKEEEVSKKVTELFRKTSQGSKPVTQPVTPVLPFRVLTVIHVSLRLVKITLGLNCS